MNFISEHRTGLIGTIVTHAIVLVLLLLFGFFTPLPLPGEEGILVNFGDSETGFGTEEPAPSESAPEKDQEEKQVEVKTPPPPPSQKASVPVEKEALMTQDMEKTVALETAKKKNEAEKKKEQDKILKEKQQQEQLEKQRLAEIEKQRLAEIARQKREKEQQLAQAAAEQRKVGEINNRAKNAFGGSGQGTSDSKSTSQGVTFPGGNQGSPQGTANAEKYGAGGGIGNGTSFNLAGRSGISLPKPYYPGNEEGIVVVQVTVNRAGNVTKAEAGVKGSNTADPELIAAARKAALQARFNVDDNAPELQTGTITYRFVLD